MKESFDQRCMIRVFVAAQEPAPALGNLPGRTPQG